MSKRKTISLCMIILNEEKFLRQSLGNAQNYVDEIIVVDGGSTDKSVAIAKEFGARVIHKKWAEDFAKQRNCAIKYATKQWILMMDADEVFEKKLLTSLQKLASNDYGIDAFAFPRKNYLNGKLTDAYPDWQFRFFQNNGKIHYYRRIHEKLTGYKMFAGPTHINIIHKKSLQRQKRQNAYYHKLDKKYKVKFY